MSEQLLLYMVIAGAFAAVILITLLILWSRGGQWDVCMDNVVYCPKSWEEVINIPI